MHNVNSSCHHAFSTIMDCIHSVSQNKPLLPCIVSCQVFCQQGENLTISLDSKISRHLNPALHLQTYYREWRAISSCKKPALTYSFPLHSAFTFMHSSLRLGTSTTCTPFELAIESHQVEMILIVSAWNHFCFFSNSVSTSLEYLRFSAEDRLVLPCVHLTKRPKESLKSSMVSGENTLLPLNKASSLPFTLEDINGLNQNSDLGNREPEPLKSFSGYFCPSIEVIQAYFESSVP